MRVIHLRMVSTLLLAQSVRMVLLLWQTSQTATHAHSLTCSRTVCAGLRQSGQGGFPQQQPQQGQWQQGQQQPQQNGWGAQQNGGFATFPPSPAQGPPHQQWGQ